MKTKLALASGQGKNEPFPTERELAQFRINLLAWFASHGRNFYWREATASNYVKIVSEVLLQRTQAGVVSKFLPDFLENYSGWKEISESDEENIGDILRPLGLWRRRAASLYALAKEVIRRQEKWPSKREELETIPGVGQYVASAILLFEYGKREPLMDASMARLLRRYFYIKPEKVDIRYDKQLHHVAYEVLTEGDPIALNWAMLDFASLQCRINYAGCNSCALKTRCRYHLQSPNPLC